MTILSSETLHASCVAIDGHAVLLWGRSGCGKSDLALRLIDRGAKLVSDDYTLLVRHADRLLATAPARIAGRIEVRGVGIVAMPHESDVEAVLIVDLEAPVVRMPEPAVRRIAGIDIAVTALAALEASAPIKIELLVKALIDRKPEQ